MARDDARKSRTATVPSTRAGAPRTNASPRAGQEADVLAIREPVRRVVAARLRNRNDVDDVVQETLARVWEARWRLDREALVAYAVVTARHLVASAVRSDDIAARHSSDLLAPPTGPAPDEEVLLREEHAAMRQALGALGEPDRALVLTHEVDGVPTAKVAADLGVGSGIVAARLARARAQLRVEYLLAFRRVSLPTSRCRPVLVALSLRDTGRQAALGAGRHLLVCPVCASLAPPLVERKRRLAGLLPLVGALPRQVRQHPLVTGGGVAAAVAAGAVAYASFAGGGAAEAPPPAAGTPGVSAPAAVRPSPPSSAPAGPDSPARFSRGVVESVPSDEGFWVRSPAGERVWVQIITAAESRATVRPGATVRLNGAYAAHGVGYARAMGVTDAEGAEALDRAGQHLEVPAGALTVE